MEEKLETGAMLNPRCQKCPKKHICVDKTLCAYLIPKEINLNTAAANLQQPIQAPVIFTPEMLENINKAINKVLINQPLKIGIDIGEGYSKSSCMEVNK